MSLGLRVAYHEAGHALAAHFLGRRVESVSIGRGGGGVVRRSRYRPKRRTRRSSADSVVVFAGEAAERYAPVQERADDDRG